VNVTIDEAKAQMTDLFLYCQAYGTRRKEDESEESYDADMEALDVALWLLDQAELVDALMEPYADKDELQERWDELNSWRHTHRRPGSNPT
jgi:hypothetical protein